MKSLILFISSFLILGKSAVVQASSTGTDNDLEEQLENKFRGTHPITIKEIQRLKLEDLSEEDKEQIIFELLKTKDLKFENKSDYAKDVRYLNDKGTFSFKS
jgi:hypothetical protein